MARRDWVNGYGSVTFKVDRRMLDEWEAALPGRVSEMARELAEDTAQEVRDNWSTRSPSEPGDPPAMVSGNLDASIEVQPVAQGFVMVRGWAVVATARYSGFLEGGTWRMRARPFLAPAAMRVAEWRLGDAAARALRVHITYTGGRG